jgi:deoxyribose-phosphate aldolase
MTHYNDLSFTVSIDTKTVKDKTETIIKNKESYNRPEIIKQLYGFIDLTSLNTSDNEAHIKAFIEPVNTFDKADIPNVAGICIYPKFIETVKNNLTAQNVKIVAVGANFPSSQTFLSIKLAEVELMVQKGADEIDVVLSVGELLAGHYDVVLSELRLIKEACGKAHLKVILETGSYADDYNLIYLASWLAMEAGADFIKTSTGKISVSATPEAVFIMATAIKDYHHKTQQKVGLKPAGGIATVDDALLYYAIVDTVLGQNWLSPNLFRIGASRLAKNILNAI